MEESMHWADQYADQVIKRKPDKKEYLVESGITPSGVVHVGNFREVMTQDLIYRALLDNGVKARYVYFWDDYDRFRKVPTGVAAEFEQYIGMPVCKVPDPYGCHDNYAEHYESRLIEENKALGINCEYLHGSKEYAKGTFADLVKVALEKADVIREIINRHRTEPRPKDWLPVEVYCENCGKDTTTVKYTGGYEVSYTCECGFTGTYDFRKTSNVKLRWRIDWPMRWAYYDVDFESSGKDHHASGGSWDTGTAICNEVFNHPEPIGPMYEFVYIKGQGEKMSSSKGNVITVSELLEVYEPEVIRYLYTTKVNRAFDMPLDADLLNVYNYYDEAEKAQLGKAEVYDNEKRRYTLSQIESPEAVEMPAFSTCVNDVQIAVGEINKTVEILQKTGHIKEPNDRIIRRIELARNWAEKYAPAEYKISLLQEMPEPSLDDNVKELMTAVAGKIEEGIAGDDLQQFIYNSAKERKLNLKNTFSEFYQLLLGREKGPRLGPFLVALNKDFVASRLRLEK